MALGLEYTLEEARLAVIARLGFPTQGGLSAAMYPFVDENIRSAHAQLYEQVEWVPQWKDEDIELIEAQDAYDFPDDCRYGQIHSVYVTDEKGNITTLLPGIKPFETEGLEPGEPIRYTFQERMLYLHPAPSEEYTKLTIQYTAMPGPIIEDGDRLSINSEAVILSALVKCKMHYGQPGVPELERDLAQHMFNIRAQNSDGETVQLGRFKKRPANKLDTSNTPSIGWDGHA